MSAWIFPCCVDKTNKSFWYEVDNAFEELGTIFWHQKVNDIAIGDIVYIYETKPVQAICWKCKVLNVKVDYVSTNSINDLKFAHGYSKPSDSYVKIIALCKYYGETRDNLSLVELLKNGLNGVPQRQQRVNAQLLTYINSVT